MSETRIGDQYQTAVVSDMALGEAESLEALFFSRTERRLGVAIGNYEVTEEQRDGKAWRVKIGTVVSVTA